MKGLILVGIIFYILFGWWFFREEHIGNPVLFYLLSTALIFRLIRLAHEWYHYWSISVPESPPRTTEWTVDMLTTFVPGEPKEMTLRTLKAMVNVRYPHTTYLCDEGNDPYLRQKCKELGVVHVTRTEKVDAKAGNINNALKQATGEIAVVLDPDHIPAPNFLDRVLPYFEDPEIGYVQCVQAYYNQNESLIAKAAAEQTYHFYGPMMMSMNKYGTAQAIGANCTFRREALDSIGGHATGLSEDMHTAMQLHSKGWKSVYIPEALSRGLAPSTLSGFYKQQLKWARGTFELLLFSFPRLLKGFTWRQKLHYSTLPLYFLYGLIALIDLIVPTVSLFQAEVPWNVELGQLLLISGPLIFMAIVIRQFAQRWLLEESERGFHLLGGILLLGTWWVYLLGFIYTLLRIKVPYIPTPKQGEPENTLALSLPNLGVILISSLAIIYGIQLDYTPYTFLMAGFAGLNIMMLTSLFVISQQKFVRDIRNKYNLKQSTDYVRGKWWKIRHHLIYPVFRRRAVFTTIVFFAGVSWYLLFMAAQNEEIIAQRMSKDVGQFYSGIDFSSGIQENDLKLFDLVAMSQHQLISENDQVMALSDSGQTIVLNWAEADEPTRSLSWQEILNGAHDEYLKTFATYLNALPGQAFLVMDVSDSSLSGNVLNDSHRAQAWEYIHKKITQNTTRTIGWIWKTGPGKFGQLQPTHHYIDWYEFDASGITDSARLFQELATMDSLMGSGDLFASRPVFISGVTEEIASMYQDNYQLYHDISSTLQRYRGQIVSMETRDELAGAFPRSFRSFSRDLNDALPHRSHDLPPGEIPDLDSSDLNQFIKGVCYNPESDWRDGHCPLTRRQLEADFESIKNMGGTYIRRYGPSIYDDNILSIAEEFDIGVFYGFNFSPHVDYLINNEEKEAYLGEITEIVTRYRSEPGIKAWVLGDNQWNQLSQTFSLPYLSQVRKAYFQFVNQAAALIHELDPGSITIASFTLEPNMAEAVQQIFLSTEIDWVGVNIYSRGLIGRFRELMDQDPLQRPWMCTGFGPRSHANKQTTPSTPLGQPIEPNPLEKARDYLLTWDALTTESDKQFKGGLAFCWKDRMAGSLSWYGLTDTDGFRKRSYRALAEKWTGVPDSSLLKNLLILTPHQDILPSGSYDFRALTPSTSDPDVTIEWALRPEGNLYETGQIRSFHNGQLGIITFPRKPGLYRVYARITHPDKSSLSTSIPVQVGAGLEAPEESLWQRYMRVFQ